MDEYTEVSRAAEDSWNDIDLSDVDITADDRDVEAGADIDVDADAENTYLKSEEADWQKLTEGEADKGNSNNEETGETDQFTLKYLGEEVTKSRQEVVTLAQKGMDYDRIRMKYDELSSEKSRDDDNLGFLRDLAKQNGYTDVDDLIDEVRAASIVDKYGVDKNAALDRVKLDRRERELYAKEQKLQGKLQGEAAAKQAEEKRQRDFREFVNEFRGVSPKDIPKEVWNTYNRGDCSLVQAYIKCENSRLKAKIAAEMKNAENRVRSAGSRTSVGRSSAMDEFDKLWYSD